MISLLRHFAQDETGATAIEYGLIAALIAIVAIAAMTRVGTNLSNKFNNVERTSADGLTGRLFDQLHRISRPRI